ncbi:hypothetical protein HOY34_01385 [Xinfangfangia sp. D13-10-4-6]|uniref:hypothetical protein n=1 Tax=Pseudogemmobacter hezensis TaxID=2737662 RepID=UPI001556A3A1|nr:hypothetical protein [Pseudogemmobacter hezensis]NPD13851.1 hypothetical protein [Pseudogemmobacter hezensis]
MIIGWIRLAFFMLIGLTIAYFLTSVYVRSLRRERLEKHWAAKELGGDRDAFVERGMLAWEKGLKRRLLWLIYIIPMVAMSAIFFIVNWS